MKNVTHTQSTPNFLLNYGQNQLFWSQKVSFMFIAQTYQRLILSCKKVKRFLSALSVFSCSKFSSVSHHKSSFLLFLMLVSLLGHTNHRGLAGPQISACWKTLEEPGASRCSRSCTLTLSPPPAMLLFKNKDSNCGMCFDPSARQQRLNFIAASSNFGLCDLNWSSLWCGQVTEK